PLILMPPRRWGLAPTRIEAPVGLQDIMPTLLHAAGIHVPAHCTGRSLMSLLRGQDQPPRDVLHGEHTDPYHTGEGMHHLADGRHKYVWYVHTGRELLFDLRDDPHERSNLAGRDDVDDLLAPRRTGLIAILKDRPE